MNWKYFFSTLLVAALAATGCSKDEPQPATAIPSPAPAVAPAERDSSSGAERAAANNVAASQPSAPAANSAPRIVSVTLEPVPAYPGTTITAEIVSSDPDDDLVTYHVQWLRNNEPVDGDFEELDTTGFSKGDLIALVVTPTDGEQEGEPGKSLPLLLHNRPPEIASLPTGMVDGRFVYQVEATDPEGDPLTFSLEGAPQGMEIDPQSGLIDWQVPPTLSGNYAIKILVSDGDAKAYQTFGLTFSQQQQ
ncbi:MAG: putative Ig domain-containing protein [Desulfuromonadales bacterium]|nr:putative Ig domain-containing protein [Desulfuromonadales bacterium]MDT8424306.1 putative Ig domain-containing protein [Desulfuromonadales bacterium]